MQQTLRNRTRTAVITLAALVLLASGLVFPAVAQELNPAVSRIASYSFGDDREPLTVVETMVRDALGDPERCLGLEKQFVTLLKSGDTTYYCRDFICRQLWIMGSDESVPVLAGMLTTDKKYSDMARYALQQNPSDKASKALRDALKKTDGDIRIGIINSIGLREDEKAIKDLVKVAQKSDWPTAWAIMNALGSIGSDKAVKELQTVRDKTGDYRHEGASCALLLVAEKRLGAGDRDAAAAIYKSLCSVGESERIKRAALIGLEACLFE